MTHTKRVKQYTKVIHAGFAKGLTPKGLIDKVVAQGYQAKVKGKTIAIDNLNMFVKLTHDEHKTFNQKELEEW